jgi:hypothetical protein
MPTAYNLPRGASAADNTTITVPVPPQRLRWLMSQLDAAGIPFDLDAGGNVTTLEAAQPIIDQVLGHQSRAQFGGGGFDLLSRQPQNRSFATDAIGFALALLAVWGVISQSARVAEWAAAAGLNPDTTRGVAISAAGLVVTLLISEIVIGRGDSRRWLFVLGMLGLFVAATWWFVAHGMGVL